MQKIFLAAATFLVVNGCGNECSFKEQCNGNVLEICGEGPDQVVNRKVHDTPCVAPNEVCVEAAEDVAYCARAPQASCDDTFDESCDGTFRVTCRPKLIAPEGVPRFVVAVDCADSNKTCVDEGMTTRCQ
ncbi:hypothetical protein [Polyangium sp. y55x31]|uniref:hypothetical protein n=1 Tax=Polyangium sp. y55x31 TaxID=3042688 RepID=UPI0024828D68|nr:hypothetical protein [Polyangium sp. y55x31]MDI1481342.1 hypothetical protein [Polyangium sp. y55x31]